MTNSCQRSGGNVAPYHFQPCIHRISSEARNVKETPRAERGRHAQELGALNVTQSMTSDINYLSNERLTTRSVNVNGRNLARRSWGRSTSRVP